MTRPLSTFTWGRLAKRLSWRKSVFSYGDFPVLRDVWLEVSEGEIVSLIGGNGAGKSTTLMAVSGINQVDSGEIRFLGEKIWALLSATLSPWVWDTFRRAGSSSPR